MKKILIRIMGIFFVLMCIGMVVIYFMLGSIIKTGLETIGPELTKSDVKVKKARLSVFGSGGITGLEVGNPTNGDFTSPFAFKLGDADVTVQITSVLSDKIVVESVVVDGAEVCFEGLNGSNHQKILENIEEFIGTQEEQPEETKEEESKVGGKKFLVKLFKMTNTKIYLHVLGQTVPIPMPNVEVTDIGADSEEGASFADTVSIIYESVFDSITNIVKQSGDLIKKSVDGIGKSAKGAFENIGEGAKGALEGIKGLFD